MFGRGGIGPMPGGAGTGFWSAEPDEHRPPGRVANVAHRPVVALPAPVGQVTAAYRLGFTGEAARQFGSVAGHHPTSRCADIMLRRSCRSPVGQRQIVGPQHNARRNIFDPFSGRALAGFAALQPHEHGAARRVAHIADQPIIALRGDRWKDNDGTPPRPRARDDAPVRMLSWTWRPPKRKGPAIAGSPSWSASGRSFGGDVLGFVHRRVLSIAFGDDFVDSRFAFDRRRFFDGASLSSGRIRRFATYAPRGPACAAVRAASPNRLASARPPAAMSPFFSCSMRLRLRVALRLSDGFENARLGHAAEEIVDGRRPAGRGDVERQSRARDGRRARWPWAGGSRLHARR